MDKKSKISLNELKLRSNDCPQRRGFTNSLIETISSGNPGVIAEIKKDKKEVKGDNGSRYLYKYLRNTIRRDDLVDEYRDFD